MPEQSLVSRHYVRVSFPFCKSQELRERLGTGTGPGAGCGPSRLGGRVGGASRAGGVGGTTGIRQEWGWETAGIQPGGRGSGWDPDGGGSMGGCPTGILLRGWAIPPSGGKGMQLGGRDTHPRGAGRGAGMRPGESGDEVGGARGCSRGQGSRQGCSRGLGVQPLGKGGRGVGTQ